MMYVTFVKEYFYYLRIVCCFEREALHFLISFHPTNSFSGISMVCMDLICFVVVRSFIYFCIVIIFSVLVSLMMVLVDGVLFIMFITEARHKRYCLRSSVTSTLMFSILFLWPSIYIKSVIVSYSAGIGKLISFFSFSICL